jgi:lipoyl(octanoyl) transferase
MAHADAVGEMERRRHRVLSGDATAMAVLFAEHPPVITIGRGGGRANVIASPARLAELGIDVVHASRGGDVTFHGPGQLMIYPVVRLRGGLVRFLEATAGAIADAAARFGVVGARWRRNPAGVWLGDDKLAACGVHVHRGVTSHGFALNVSTPAAWWELIVPCGLAGGRVTSLRAVLGDRCPSVQDVACALGPELSARL